MRLAAFALLVPLIGCDFMIPPIHLNEEMAGVKYLVMENHTVMPSGAEDGTAVHNAVIEALLSRPELPYNFGGHDTGWQKYGHGRVTKLAPAISKGLAANGSVNVLREDAVLTISVSKRAKIMVVAWFQISQLGEAENFVYDLARVPNAFEPGAELDVATVRKYARLEKGR